MLTLGLAFVVLSALGAAPALADSAETPPSHSRGDVYVGLEGGLTAWNRIDPNLPGVGKSDFLVGAGVTMRAGLQWRDHVRFDGQVGWTGAKAGDTADRIDIVHATAQAYWDFSEPGAWVRPYVGLGLGIAGGWLQNNPANVPPASATSKGVGLAYIVAGGGRFRLDDDWSLACAYHFLGTGALIDDGQGGHVNPTLHSFMVGFHRRF